jgi:hypothetical protein
VCPATEILTIFPNLEELVEFQHRFLSKLEASVAASYERVGLVFTKLVGCLLFCSALSSARLIFLLGTHARGSLHSNVRESRDHKQARLEQVRPALCQ